MTSATDNRTTERVDHPPRVREAIDELMREKDVTDNRTTELREKLTERGVDYEVKDLPNIKFFHDTRWNANGVRWCYTEFVGATTCLTMCNEWKDCTPEQAIAATLGSDEPPYDELLRCLENDWHISASWDGLRKFWCIELTEEGVKLRDATHGTLTSEQVEKAIHDCSTYASYDGCTYYASGIRLQAIADELNARAERTCKLKWTLQGETQTQEFWRCECGNCGECFGVEDRSSFPFKMTIDEVEAPNYCPNCGRKVVGV